MKLSISILHSNRVQLPQIAIVLLLNISLLWISPVRPARILAMIPFFASSHHRFHQPVLKALAQAGHEVVVYTPFHLTNPPPNYTEVLLEDPPNSTMITKIVTDLIATPRWKCLDHFLDVVEVMFQFFMKTQKLQQLLESKEKFDLVITEAFTSQEFLLMYGYKFKAPVIALQAFCTSRILSSVFGNDFSLSYIPEMCSPFPNKMTFLQRLETSVFGLRGLAYIYYNKVMSKQDAFIKTYFPDTPPVSEMINNVSLVFVNDHLTADYARPRTPNIIPVGSIHIEDGKTLPHDIQKFLDEATDGAILFSLGTYTPDHLEPNYYFDMYKRVFSQLRQKVLWKTKKESINELPPNVMISNWVPQRDFLAHPNTVLFITHGGMMSLHETIHCGVPVVCIPQFCDQFRNSAFYEAMGIGKRLDIVELTDVNILDAIRTVLHTPKYSENVKKLSLIQKDLPRKPAETVVYWTEYVLRHHGASHLKPIAAELTWYQLYLVDVIAVIFVLVVFVASTVYVISKRLLNTLISRTSANKVKKS